MLKNPLPTDVRYTIIEDCLPKLIIARDELQKYIDNESFDENDPSRIALISVMKAYHSNLEILCNASNNFFNINFPYKNDVLLALDYLKDYYSEPSQVPFENGDKVKSLFGESIENIVYEYDRRKEIPEDLPVGTLREIIFEKFDDFNGTSNGFSRDLLLDAVIHYLDNDYFFKQPLELLELKEGDKLYNPSGGEFIGTVESIPTFGEIQLGYLHDTGYSDITFQDILDSDLEWVFVNVKTNISPLLFIYASPVMSSKTIKKISDNAWQTVRGYKKVKKA